MRQALVIIAVFLPVLAAAQQPLPKPEAAPQAQAIRVYFSPHGGCTDAVIRELAQAKHDIFVQAYSFTSAPIVRALLEAKKRDIDVQIILDKSNRTARYSSADLADRAGIPTSIDSQHAIAHNKIMIIDGQTVITGSFNFTTAAEDHNAENLIIIHDQKIAAKFLENWKRHRAHAKTYLR